jgi:large subunit ribosomal protein L17
MRALSRKTASRKSLLRNLATSLVLYERIETTEAKAKEVKSEVEHLLSVAKKNDLATRRHLLGYFFDKNATKKVLEVLVPRYEKTSSGFIKTYRKGKRLGDNAMIMILELKKVQTIKTIQTVQSEEKVEETKEIIKEGKDASNKKRKQIGGDSFEISEAKIKTRRKTSPKTDSSK